MANQAWQIAAPGKLSLNDLGDIPKPGPNEVLVRIHAASLNYRDILIGDHNPDYRVTHKNNLIPCNDGAGIIEAVGEGSRWAKGDHIIIHPHAWLYDNKGLDLKLNEILGGGEYDGTLRRWMIVSDERLVKAPKGLSMEEASTMFTAGVTAFRAVFHGGVDVGPGTTVLTQGTGGLSCYAILLAAAAGATVIATSSSDEKLKVAKKLGAAYLINYRSNPDWATKVLEVTGGKGVDLVVDVVGAQSIKQTLKAAKFGGVICILGLLSEDPNMPVDIVQDILYGQKTLKGQLGGASREILREMSAFMEKHDLHPQVAQAFEFEDAREAYKALRNLSAPGKIVIRC